MRAKTLKPKPRINLIEWADTHRYLSSKGASLSGRWKTNRIVPAREPMLAATDPKVKKIVVMSCTQLMKTEILLNIIGYHIHLDPGPIILMEPTIDMAEAISKDRIEPMLTDSKELNELVNTKKSKNSKNTILHKSFPGGQLTLIGANSPTSLASRPVRIILADEVDKYPESAGDEGDPIGLITERAATFFNKKIVICSSPTIKGRSRIEFEYNLSDKRVYKAPCPKCEIANELLFVNVKWTDNNPETAHYKCPECSHQWTEVERKLAIAKGFYEATAPFKGIAGFKVNKIASPWESLSVLVEKYLASKDDAPKLAYFTNTNLAETFEVRGEAPEYMRLYERRERYPMNSIPKGVVFLTAGCDVQSDRIELEIVGWGRNKESWSIDYRVIPGDPAQVETWYSLDKILNETWETTNKQELRIKTLAIDSGYKTAAVYEWARRYPTNRVIVVKGQDALQNILGIPKGADVTHSGVTIKKMVKVWPVGVSVLKTELYGWLNLNSAGDDGIYPHGFCHFPQYDEQFFKMLTAEQLMVKSVNGKTVYRWEKTFERNEALDCRNYARAAANFIGMDRFKEKDWLILEGQQPIKEVPIKTSETKTQIKREPAKPNSYWGNSGRKSFW